MAVPAFKANLGSGLGKLTSTLGPRVNQWMERLGARDPDALPILKAIPSEQRMPLVMLVLVASLLLATLSFIGYALMANRQGNMIEESTHLQMLSQRIAKSAQQAALGNKAAFAQLKQGRDDFNTSLGYLTGGSVDSSAAPQTKAGDKAELHRLWQASRKGLDVLLAQEATLVDIGQAINQINVRNTELLDLTEQFAALLPGGSGRLSAYANQQALWTQRMAKNANALISGDVINPETAFQLGKDTKTYREVLNGMLEGSAELGLSAVSDPQAKEKLLELREAFAAYEGQVNTLLKNMAPLVEAKRASRAIFEDSEKLLTLADRLTEHYEGGLAWLLLVLAVLFTMLAIGSLVLLVLGNAADSRKRAEEAARVNQRNQDAILRDRKSVV
jgi:twitching motility protein PilJ